MYKSQGYNFTPRVELSYEYGELFTASPSYSYNYNYNDFSNYTVDKTNNFVHVLKLEMTSRWPKNVVIGNDFGYTYNSNIADGFQKDFYLYIKFVTKEIVLSSIHILHTALTLKNFEDDIITITMPQNISTYQTLLVVISITITPGTSVINVEKNKLTVHCLTKSIKNSLEEMTFVHKVLSFKF